MGSDVDEVTSRRRGVDWLVVVGALAAAVIAACTVLLTQTVQVAAPQTAAPAFPQSIQLEGAGGATLTASLVVAAPGGTYMASFGDADGLSFIGQVVTDATTDVGLLTVAAWSDVGFAGEVTVPMDIACVSGCADAADVTVDVTVDVERRDATTVPDTIAVPAPDRAVGQWVPSEIIVAANIVDDLGGTVDRVREVAARTGGVIVGAIPYAGVLQIAWPGNVAADHVDTFRQIVGVDDAFIHQVFVTGDDKVSNDYPDGSWEDDPTQVGGTNWHLEAVNAAGAWDLTTGDRDVKLAVIDSSFQTSHDELAPNLVASYPDGQKPSDSHGTHVAALACGAGNDGRGITGVAWTCGLHTWAWEALDVLEIYDTGFEDQDRTTSIQFLNGTLEAVRSGARIVNVSFGTQFTCDPAYTEDQHVVDAHNALFDIAYSYSERRVDAGLGTLFVLTAGNSCRDAREHAPGGSVSAEFRDITVTVAATNADDSLVPLSNFGPGVDIAAPGGFDTTRWAEGHPLKNQYAIWSARACPGWLRLECRGNDKYTGAVGTSMAAPIVSGIAVLVAAQHPEFTASQLRSCLLAAGERPVSVPDPWMGKAIKKESPATAADLDGLRVIDAEQAVRCDGAGAPAAAVPDNQLLVLSEDAVEELEFGTPADVVVTQMTERFGSPTSDDTRRLFRGVDLWVFDEEDTDVEGQPVGGAWVWPVLRETCWGNFCVTFGGANEAEAQLTGWSVTGWDWDAPLLAATPDVVISGTDLTIGSTFADLVRYFPDAGPYLGEGGGVGIDPWAGGLYDGVGTWRLLGNTERTSDYRIVYDEGLDASVIMRMSAGDGPTYGCC